MRKRFIVWIMLAMIICGLLPLASLAETDEENLVAGLPYTIETGEPVSKSYANYQKGSWDVDNGQFTDGKTKGGKYWYKAFRAQSRIVTFDLGSECAITRIEAGFLHQKASGIYAPRYINVYLSDDNVTYGTAIEYETGYPLSTAEARYDAVVELDKTYSARYVKVEFCCDIFAFCDEISVYGAKTLDGTEAKVIPDKPEEAPGYLQSAPGHPEISDMMKLYNGYYAPAQAVANLTESELLPYVAYLDTEGNIVDTMYDAITFVPCHTDYPSGGRLVLTGGKPGAVMSDWELYFNQTFKNGQDVDALDKVVGRVYGELGIDGKYPVVLTIPYPTVIDKPFGDLDGDGIEEYCRTLEERTAIVKWYVDKCINTFAEKGYENIELLGFYWYREEVNYSNSDHEGELAIAMNDYVHSNNLLTFFDPFYLSIGFDHYQELGFDGTVMQPNAAFAISNEANYYFEISMLEEFAQTAYNHYLGVEIETDEPSVFRGSKYLAAGYNYESYLYYGWKTGYMDSLHSYYQGAGPGSIYDFCHGDINTAKGQYLRRLYDLTYQFIKETYKNESPVLNISESSVEITVADGYVTIGMEIIDEDSHSSNISVEFPREPSGGIIGATANKQSIVYKADEGFVGEDKFSVRVTDGFNYSEEIEITVLVTDDSASNVSDNSLDTSDPSAVLAPPASAQDESAPIWLIVIAALLAVAVVVAAVTVIRKHKK